MAQAIEAKLGTRVKRLAAVAGELTYEVAPKELTGACLALRDTAGLQFEMLIDLSGIDYLHHGEAEWRTDSATRTGFSRGVERGSSLTREARPRFSVAYHLLSIANNVRLRLHCPCDDADPPMLDSVVEIWNSANWYEREAFDLFGILFLGHPDLRRILTDYGFIGHPFRKDFPLIGNVEVRYDPEQGRVIYEPVSITPRTVVPKVIRKDADHV